MEKLLKSLKKEFPGIFFRPSEDFDGSEGGIWTGLAEQSSNNVIHWDNNRLEFESAKLAKWLDENYCFAEPYDSGTLFIYPDNPLN